MLGLPMLKLSRFSICICITALTLTLNACTVSTESGYIWSQKDLVGQPYPQACIKSFTVDISGRSPWLEQQARRLWLEQLTARNRRCNQDQAIHVTISDVRVSNPADAYGYPDTPAEEINPVRTRTRVQTSAKAEFVQCKTGGMTSIDLNNQTWVPFVTDTFLAEERAMAALPELIARSAAQLDRAIWEFACEATQ